MSQTFVLMINQNILYLPKIIKNNISLFPIQIIIDLRPNHSIFYVLIVQRNSISPEMRFVFLRCLTAQTLLGLNREWFWKILCDSQIGTFMPLLQYLIVLAQSVAIMNFNQFGWMFCLASNPCNLFWHLWCGQDAYRLSIDEENLINTDLFSSQTVGLYRPVVSQRDQHRPDTKLARMEQISRQPSSYHI